MTDYKQKLEQHIHSSTLDASQKLLWFVFLKLSTEYESEAVFEAVSENQEYLDLLTKNLKSKIDAMKDGSEEAWQKALDEEKKMLESL